MKHISKADKDPKRAQIVRKIALILSVFLFFLTALNLDSRWLKGFDSTLISFVQSFETPGLTDFMLAVTSLGSVRGIALLTAVFSILLFLFRSYRFGLFLIVSVSLGAGAFNRFLKEMFQRIRPDIHPIITEQGYSFPSGHSMGSLIFYGSLAILLFQANDSKIVRFSGVAAAILFIIWIGLSRIYLGVHFPSDVIGGYTAGIIWLLFVASLFHITEKATGD